MGYYHIDNLYKAKEILAFRECYALEKIHGTSAHITWQDGAVSFFSGGESHDRFVALFDVPTLQAKFAERFQSTDHVVVHGEAYGGKCQDMSHTYGTNLKFVAFDVKVGEAWLAVPQAAEFVQFLGLEFVAFSLIPTVLDVIDGERDKPSTQAIRNGIMEPKMREGIVLRPPFEVTLNNGRRVIAKHKRDEFAERIRPEHPKAFEERAQAEEVALEWVTSMRLAHVIDTLVSERDVKDVSMQDTPLVIKAMIEDVLREGSGEVTDSLMLRRAISSRAVKLFKQKVQHL